MQQAFEELAQLVGNLLAERWLSRNRPNIPTDTNAAAKRRDILAPKDVPSCDARSAISQPDCESSS